MVCSHFQMQAGDVLKIIAEIGWNFMGDMLLAERMIAAAARAGATTAKFQYWDPSSLRAGPWDQDGRREIYEKAALTEAKLASLVDLCARNRVSFLVSAFNREGAAFLKKMGMSEIKIPSHEVANTELIKYCAENFDVVYFSTGASKQEEVEAANEILKSSNTDYYLMHCVSSYPCPEKEANLPRMHWLRSLHGQIGLSDHTQSLLTPAIAVGLGARVIEKHFTVNKDLPGRDNKFAVNEEEFLEMVGFIRSAEEMLTDKGRDHLCIETDTVENYRGRWG